MHALQGRTRPISRLSSMPDLRVRVLCTSVQTQRCTPTIGSLPPHAHRVVSVFSIRHSFSCSGHKFIIRPHSLQWFARFCQTVPQKNAAVTVFRCAFFFFLFNLFCKYDLCFFAGLKQLFFFFLYLPSVYSVCLILMDKCPPCFV